LWRGLVVQQNANVRHIHHHYGPQTHSNDHVQIKYYCHRCRLCCTWFYLLPLLIHRSWLWCGCCGTLLPWLFYILPSTAPNPSKVALNRRWLWCGCWCCDALLPWASAQWKNTAHKHLYLYDEIN
jgi:hypothetical protein